MLAYFYHEVCVPFWHIIVNKNTVFALFAYIINTMGKKINHFDLSLRLKFKKQYYNFIRNKLFGSYLLLTIAFFVMIVILSVYLMKYDFAFDKSDLIRIGIGISALCVSLYWSRDHKFGRKWTYCASTYNEIYIKPKNPFEDKLILEFKRALFAADLLDCGLWRHKSFYREFNLILHLAIDSCRKNNSNLKTPGANEFNTNKVRLDIVRQIISEYINNLENIVQDTEESSEIHQDRSG